MVNQAEIMTEFVVTSPDGKEYVVNAPEGATQEQALDYAKSQFQSTAGGAAVGSPNVMRQGERAKRTTMGTSLLDIGGSAGFGGALGAVAPEIMIGAGKFVGGLPSPIRAAAPFLENAGIALRNAGRPAAIASGAVAGAIAETSGQAVEAAGGEQPFPDLARIAGGAVGPELKTLAIWAVKKFAGMTGVDDLLAAARKYIGKDINLNEAQKTYLASEIEALRGGIKTNEPLEQVGSIMGAEGQRLMSVADQRLIAAQAQAAGMKPTGVQPEMADVGGSLQNTINTRFKQALKDRKTEYKTNERTRDAIVSQRETSGSYVNNLPEYRAVVAELEAQLANEPAMRRSPSVQASYQKILNDLTNPETTAAEKKLVLSGQNLDLVEVSGQAKPISFKALDDVRRKLGDAFRGKPAEGYDAIGEKAAKDLYGKVSNIQKTFAGGKGGPQGKLLDDYAERTEGLNIFSSKYGKKATALDQYREDTFATDPSSLPTAYFKTRASVQTLKELTGSAAQVNTAALAFANKELVNKDAAAVRAWLGKNSEWLAETGPTRAFIDRYATALETSERSLRNAEDFAKQAAKDSGLLTRQALPAQRAVDLIKSGDTDLWSKVIPAIQQSPQAKAQMVQAVRQVVADQASSKGTIDLFSRNIRPFLEQSKIASKAEMDFISGKLEAIRAMNVPEEQKLGIARRFILQGAAGWTASVAGRGTTAAFGTLGNMGQLVPE